MGGVDAAQEELLARLPEAVREAFHARGYETLTPVQQAVLDPALEAHDLRISSQTGSGKTLAIAFVLANVVTRAPEALAQDAGDAADAEEESHEARITRERAKARRAKAAWPRALVVTPTRELAAQVREEIAWALEKLGVRVAVVAGGSSYPAELKTLAQKPQVIVATPGRLVDHLEREHIVTDHVATIVLDEADQMLDLGFRDDLEVILGKLPPSRRTHLVSATFSRDVLQLAARYQRDARSVEGTRLGELNKDIDHVVHLVPQSQHVDALVNILLASPGEQTLVFARTRADVAEISEELMQLGFPVASLSGEMQQEARNRALAAFRSGTLRALVATDVAARGIDVQDIARVVQMHPPGNAEDYVHRSGRTGRAGRKGTSVMLVSPAMESRARQILRRANVWARVEPVPSARDIERAADERAFDELTREVGEREAGNDPRLLVLAKRLLDVTDAEVIIARLLGKSQHGGPTAPRSVRSAMPFASSSTPTRESARGASDARSERRDPSGRGHAGTRDTRPSSTRQEHDTRYERGAFESRSEQHAKTPRAKERERAALAQEVAQDTAVPVAEAQRFEPKSSAPESEGHAAETDEALQALIDAMAPEPGKAAAPRARAEKAGRPERPSRVEHALHDARSTRDERPARGERALKGERSSHPERAPRAEWPQRDDWGARGDRGDRGQRGDRGERGAPFDRPERGASFGAPARGWVPFTINWGERHGADPRRLLALVCRRGDIRGTDVGAIRIGAMSSTFQVSRDVIDGFEKGIQRRDARDPGLHIDRFEGDAVLERPRPYMPKHRKPPIRGGGTPPRRFAPQRGKKR